MAGALWRPGVPDRDAEHASRDTVPMPPPSTPLTEKIADDLITALDEYTSGAAIHPEGIDDLAEFVVEWFLRRRLLAGIGPGPVLFLLTDEYHVKDVTRGLYASLTDAKVAARRIVAKRGKAAASGDDWKVTADEDGNRSHRWAPVQLGSPIGDFTIREMPVI